MWRTYSERLLYIGGAWLVATYQSHVPLKVSTYYCNNYWFQVSKQGVMVKRPWLPLTRDTAVHIGTRHALHLVSLLMCSIGIKVIEVSTSTLYFHSNYCPGPLFTLYHSNYCFHSISNIVLFWFYCKFLTTLYVHEFTMTFWACAL